MCVAHAGVVPPVASVRVVGRRLPDKVRQLQRAGSPAATPARRAAMTRSGPTDVMQRWSSGHSRSMQGRHHTSWVRMRCGPSGAVAHSRVGPNTDTVGVPSARGQVHRARVVGEHARGQAEHPGERQQRRAPGQVDHRRARRAGVSPRCTASDAWPIGRRAHQDDHARRRRSTPPRRPRRDAAATASPRRRPRRARRPAAARSPSHPPSRSRSRASSRAAFGNSACSSSGGRGRPTASTSAA